MNSTRDLVILLIASIGMLSGCSCDNDSTSSPSVQEGDVGQDTDDSGVQSDANPIVTPDTGEDTGGEEDAETTDVTEDIADMEPDLPVEDPYCDNSADDACEGEQACVGGACLDPLEGDYTVNGALTYAAEIKFPGAEVGFDVNGDGGTDNVLGTLISGLSQAEATDGQGEVDAAIEVGEINLLVEFDALDDALSAEEMTVRFIFASADADGDRYPELTHEERAQGAGVYTIIGNSVDAYGPTFQYAGASASEGTLAGDPISMIARTLIPNLTEDRVNDIPVHGLQVGGALATNNDGKVVSGDGGFLVGGALPIEFIAETLNNSAVECPAECGVPADQALFQVTETDNSLTFECATELPEPYGCADHRSAICSNLPGFCDQTGTIAILADVDTNGNGTDDGLSFAVQLTLEPAAISEELPIAPVGEICGNGIDDDRDFRIECWDSECDDEPACQP